MGLAGCVFRVGTSSNERKERRGTFLDASVTVCTPTSHIGRDESSI